MIGRDSKNSSVPSDGVLKTNAMGYQEHLSSCSTSGSGSRVMPSAMFFLFSPPAFIYFRVDSISSGRYNIIMCVNDRKIASLVSIYN